MQPITPPSKKFFRSAAVVTGIVAILITVQTAWFRGLFQSEKPASAIPDGLTVRQAIQNDSNQNSIPDWEERLWGLDPTVAVTDGVANKVLVEQKRKQYQTGEAAPTTKTDQLSRSLFALSVALGEDADAAVLEKIAEEIGAQINTNGLVNQYRLASIKTVQTTQASLEAYYAALSARYKKYPTIGTELPLIAAASDTGVIEDPEALRVIAVAHKALARELAAIPTPIGITTYHLAIINHLDHIGSSIELILALEEDGVDAVLGAGFYGNYTLALAQSSEALKEYLSEYSILER